MQTVAMDNPTLATPPQWQITLSEHDCGSEVTVSDSKRIRRKMTF